MRNRTIIKQQKYIATLEAAIEADRTRIIDGVNRVERALNDYFWLTEGRGSYEWDDDRYKKEFGKAASVVLKALEPLRKIGADLTNCPQTTAEVVKARADKDAKIADLESQLAESQERLAMAVEAIQRISNAIFGALGMGNSPCKCRFCGIVGRDYPSLKNHEKWCPKHMADAFLTAQEGAATAAHVAQHTAEVERRGAAKELRRLAGQSGTRWYNTVDLLARTAELESA